VYIRCMHLLLQSKLPPLPQPLLTSHLSLEMCMLIQCLVSCHISAFAYTLLPAKPEKILAISIKKKLSRAASNFSQY